MMQRSTGLAQSERMIARLFYLAETLAKQRRPKGTVLQIISNAGGPAVIAVDPVIKQAAQLLAQPETSDELKGPSTVQAAYPEPT